MRRAFSQTFAARRAYSVPPIRRRFRETAGAPRGTCARLRWRFAKSESSRRDRPGYRSRGLAAWRVLTPQRAAFDTRHRTVHLVGSWRRRSYTRTSTPHRIRRRTSGHRDSRAIAILVPAGRAEHFARSLEASPRELAIIPADAFAQGERGSAVRAIPQE